MLALNVGAMLIAFLAFIALFDVILSSIKPAILGCFASGTDFLPWWPNDLRVATLLGYVFQPVALLMGVSYQEAGLVGELLGIKMAANETVAYQLLLNPEGAFAGISERSKLLSIYALTGFANFSSIGIQLGGIGALAPDRRSDLASLGLKALFVGFTATLINASVAGLFLN
jgi:concentrative nucleoside transporter, CNT family